MKLHPVLLALLWLFSSGVSPYARAQDGTAPFSTLGEALGAARNGAETLVFSSPADVRAHAVARIQRFKPHKTLSDYIPTEFLEYTVGTTMEGQVLQEFYEAYEEEFRVTGGVTAVTMERLLLLAMGAQDLPTLDEMVRSLPTARRARYHLERPLAQRRINEGFALWDRYQADPREPLKRVRVYRFSSERPSDLKQLLIHYRTAGFKVEVSSVNSVSMEADVNRLAGDSHNVIDRLVSNAPVAQQEEVRGFLPQLHRAAVAAKERALLAIGMLKRSELVEYQVQPQAPRGWWSNLKSFGRVFTREFRDVQRSRTALDKLMELAVAGGTMAFTTWAVEQSLARDMARGEVVNTVLPVVYAALDKLFFLYMQQPISAFHGQGISFDFRTNRFDKNAAYLLGSNFIHSVVYRYGLLMATNAVINPDGTWLLGPALATALFAEGCLSALRNVYSKGPIQFFLEKLRDYYNSHNKRRHTVVAFGIFSALWAVVAMGDIFHWTMGEALSFWTTMPESMQALGLREMMVGLSVVGIGIELARQRHSIVDAIRTVWARMKGERPQLCETFFVLERPDGR